MLLDPRLSSQVLDEVAAAVASDESQLRVMVLARCVQLGLTLKDATGMKALELLARLALGDSGYTNQGEGMNLGEMTTEDLEAVAAYIDRAVKWERSNE